MGNKYFLKIAALGQFPELEIDQSRFDELKSSRSILSHALAIEEKYSIVISNFLELEREAINVSIYEMVQSPIEYNDFFSIRLALNTRLVNLLTSVRLYIDQLSGHIDACLPSDTEAKKKTKLLLTTEYDSHFEYRFMEALRNYVQHSGTPVHRVSTGSAWRSSDDERLLEFSLYFATQRKELISDGKFKKRVLDEMPEEVNLKSSTRMYIESINNIHVQARALIELAVETSRLMLDNAIRDYADLYNSKVIGLSAYKYQGKDKIDEVLIFTEWDDVRRKLVKKNRKLINLGKRYVSSQPINK